VYRNWLGQVWSGRGSISIVINLNWINYFFSQFTSCAFCIRKLNTANKSLSHRARLNSFWPWIREGKTKQAWFLNDNWMPYISLRTPHILTYSFWALTYLNDLTIKNLDHKRTHSQCLVVIAFFILQFISFFSQLRNVFSFACTLVLKSWQLQIKCKSTQQTGGWK
jgi:hypothetical protein